MISDQHPFNICLQGLLTKPSRGWSLLIKPPEITQSVILLSFIFFSLVCTRKLSSLRRELLSGRPSWSAVPYMFKNTHKNFLRCPELQVHFHSKITIGGKIKPQAQNNCDIPLFSACCPNDAWFCTKSINWLVWPKVASAGISSIAD